MTIKTLLLSALAVALGLMVGLWAYQKFLILKTTTTTTATAQVATTTPVTTIEQILAQEGL